MKRRTKLAAWMVAALLLLLWRQFGPGLPTETLISDGSIAQAFAEHRSGVMVEVSGRVQRLLPDTSRDSQRQRFVLELDNGHILLVENNLRHSSEVPLEQWAPVTVRGEYHWTAQGGRIERTHRDPGFGLKQGWIEYRGKRYD
jgi:hypothetical protein